MLSGNGRNNYPPGGQLFLVQEFSPHFTEDDLVNLSKFNVYMKLMIDGVSSSPFSATTIPPLFQQEPEAQSNLEKIIKVSRERYAKSREEIEDKIARWSGMTKEQLEVKEDSNQSKSGERKSGEQNIKKFKKKESEAFETSNLRNEVVFNPIREEIEKRLLRL